MRESDVERYLVRRTKEAGGEIRKVRWVGRRGAPDRLVMLPGVTIWVELKRPGGVTQPHQEREHGKLKKMGQQVVVIDSKQAIDTLFKEIQHDSKKEVRRCTGKS